jgi:hypothetical protein
MYITVYISKDFWLDNSYRIKGPRRVRSLAGVFGKIETGRSEENMSLDVQLVAGLNRGIVPCLVTAVLS